MAEVKWIKIVTDVFNDEKIKLIEMMPDADTLLVIWFKILCLAGKSNRSGMLMLSDKIHYNDEMLSNIFNRPLTTIRLALKAFEEFGMIEIIDNTYYISNWEKHQSVESLDKIREQTKARVQKHRSKALGCNVTSSVTVTQSNETEEELELEEDEDISIIIKHFEDNIGSTISSIQLEKIISYIEILGTDLIKYSFEIAADNNKKAFSYIETILKNWTSSNIRTKQQALEDSESFKKKNERKAQPKNNRSYSYEGQKDASYYAEIEKKALQQRINGNG
jgi:predicted phage replisome organizer